jgi:hypothetical protein
MDTISYSFYDQDLRVDAFNGIHDFILFKYLKDMSILTSYTPLDAPTLNPNISFIGLPSLFLLNKKVRNQYGKCRIIGGAPRG